MRMMLKSLSQLLGSCSLTSSRRRAMATESSKPLFKFLELEGGERLAYERVEGREEGAATVLYVPGFTDGKEETKGTHMRQHCIDRGLHYVRYDPLGVGDSSGSLDSLQFSDWVSNASTVLERLCPTPTVLLGSSMGGWISVRLALQHRQKVAGLVRVAPALNFLRPYYQHYYSSLPKEVQVKLDRGELHLLEEEDGSLTPLMKSFVESSVEWEIDLGRGLDLQVPCRILHGVRDASVPYGQSVALMEALGSQQVELIVRKEAEHRFTEPKSLEIISQSIDALVAQL
jgi:pimeloyl-ACP methyl ester carboxylesterase